MSFNEFRQHRFDIIEHHEVIDPLVHLSEEECRVLLLKMFEKYKDFLEPSLPFFQIKENSTYKSALVILVKEISKTNEVDIFCVGENGEVNVEIDCEVQYLAWIPIRPFLNFRNNKDVFEKICYVLGQISQYVECEHECFREMEKDLLQDDCEFDEVYHKEKRTQIKLYEHYMKMFKGFKKTFTNEEILKSAENNKSLTEFFKDAIKFLENPTSSSVYNGFYHGNIEDFRPIESQTIYNFCWDYDSELDNSITEHINSIANEAGFMNISFFKEISEIKSTEQELRFESFNNLFSKNYGFY